MRHRTARYVASSILLLVPCLWQGRIQAGDLSSHIYNAWLAQRIAAGDALGLVIAPQSTNVLFDLLLKALMTALGADLAQRIAVSALVLVFVWGGFALARCIAGREPWAILPAIAMLAYGWVFRMGLFNFYLALGLSFWALAVSWKRTRRGLAIAALLLAIGYTAHGLPVAWAIAVFAYRQLAPAWRMLPAAAFAAIVALRITLQSAFQTRWINTQWIAAAGANQFWIYGSRYLVPACAMVALWAVLIGLWMRGKGLRATAGDATLGMSVLTAVGILLIPDVILIPKYSHALAYIGQRMSLALGVLLCGLAARANRWPYLRYAPSAIAVVFFAFVWQDESTLNALEDRMEAVVDRLPPGQRIISALQAPDVATIPTTHMIDRVCVGRCYSYGNYEPSSRQFRVRVAGRSPVVVATDDDANAIQFGTYVVRPDDAPLYQVVLAPAGGLALRQLQPGQMTGIELWTGLR
jgi:hypothetical protein